MKINPPIKAGSLTTEQLLLNATKRLTEFTSTYYRLAHELPRIKCNVIRSVTHSVTYTWYKKTELYIYIYVCITTEKTERGNIFSFHIEFIKHVLRMFHRYSHKYLYIYDIYVTYLICNKRKVKSLLFAITFLWLEKSIHFFLSKCFIFYIVCTYNSIYIKGMDQRDPWS